MAADIASLASASSCHASSSVSSMDIDDLSSEAGGGRSTRSHSEVLFLDFETELANILGGSSSSRKVPPWLNRLL